MRHQWYGDGRDLIKWGVLIHLATTWNLRRIIHVAYLRPDAARPVLESRREPIPVPDSVWAHFRDIRDIRRLAVGTGIEISVLGAPFDAKDRESYTHEVIANVRSSAQRPVAVFLDQDTGIAERNVRPKHVTPAEVRDIWGSLNRSDWLVLYQHSNRRTEWLSTKRAEFARAIDIAHVETFRARNGARDVAFFCAVRE